MALRFAPKTKLQPNAALVIWKERARERADDVFFDVGIKKHRSKENFAPMLVRVAGFEPTASWTRTKRDTKLRHTRITLIIIASYSGSVKWKSRRGKIMRRRGSAYHVPRRR